MQIPKIIHYFYDNVDLWKKGPNSQVRMCVCSWKKACPDYAFMLWHDRHPEFGEILRQSLFVRRAYELKLWAFVADYVRLYALHKYGGIYLDTDVQLLKNFDAFLNDGFFVSVEGDIREGENIPEPAVMGSVPGHPLLEETMKFYRSNHIFNWQNPIVPTVMKAAMRKFCGFSRIDYSSPEETRRAEMFYFGSRRCDDYELYRGQRRWRNEEKRVSVYPGEYFCPCWYTFREKALTENTVAVHWNQSSWWNKDAFARLRASLKPKLPPPAEEKAFCLFGLPLAGIRRSRTKTKISVLGMIGIRMTPTRFRLRLFGFLPLLKVVRKN